MSVAESGVLIRRDRPTTSQSTSPIISTNTISINESSPNRSFETRISLNRSSANDSFVNRFSIKKKSKNSSSATKSSASSSSATKSSASSSSATKSSASSSSATKSSASSSSTNNRSANSIFVSGSSLTKSSASSSSENRKKSKNSSSATKNSASSSSTNNSSAYSKSANSIFVSSSSSTKSSASSSSKNRKKSKSSNSATKSSASSSSTNNSSANSKSANSIFVSSSSTTKISANRSSANGISANSSTLYSSQACSISINRNFANGSSSTKNSTNSSSVNRNDANSSFANNFSENRRSLYSSCANEISINRNSVSGSSETKNSANRSYTNSNSANDISAISSSGNRDSLNNKFHPTPIPHRGKLAKYVKCRQLMLPQLSFSSIWECPILQSLLMRDEYSKYVVTEDELNHLQWELEAMLTSINVRQTTIANEILTYRAYMYIRQNPDISSKVGKRIPSRNTFDHDIEVEFGPICSKLSDRRIESAIFWSFVRPYLAYLSKNNFKWLEDMVEYFVLNKELFNTPPIGEHYSIKWVKKQLEINKMQEKLPSFLVELMNKVNCFKYDENIYVAKYERVVINVAKDSQTSQDFDDTDKSQEISTVEEKCNSKQCVHLKSILQLEEKLETSLNKPEILNFEIRQDKPWTEEQKIDYIAKVDDNPNSLLRLHNFHLEQIPSNVFDNKNNESISYDPSASKCNDSDTSSDDESNTTRVYVVTKPSEYITNIKQNIKTEDECLTEENIKSKVIGDDKVIDFEEAKDDVIEIEYKFHRRISI